jgi:hypothetical protein
MCRTRLCGGSNAERALLLDNRSDYLKHQFGLNLVKTKKAMRLKTWLLLGYLYPLQWRILKLKLKHLVPKEDTIAGKYSMDPHTQRVYNLQKKVHISVPTERGICRKLITRIRQFQSWNESRVEGFKRISKEFREKLYRELKLPDHVEVAANAARSRNKGKQKAKPVSKWDMTPPPKMTVKRIQNWDLEDLPLGALVTGFSSRWREMVSIKAAWVQILEDAINGVISPSRLRFLENRDIYPKIYEKQIAKAVYELWLLLDEGPIEFFNRRLSEEKDILLSEDETGRLTMMLNTMSPPPSLADYPDYFGWKRAYDAWFSGTPGIIQNSEYWKLLSGPH